MSVPVGLDRITKSAEPQPDEVFSGRLPAPNDELLSCKGRRLMRADLRCQRRLADIAMSHGKGRVGRRMLESSTSASERGRVVDLAWFKYSGTAGKSGGKKRKHTLT